MQTRRKYSEHMPPSSLSEENKERCCFIRTLQLEVHGMRERALVPRVSTPTKSSLTLQVISAFTLSHDDSCSPSAKRQQQGNPRWTPVKVRCCHSDKQCKTWVIRVLFGKKRGRQNIVVFSTYSVVLTDALRVLANGNVSLQNARRLDRTNRKTIPEST